MAAKTRFILINLAGLACAVFFFCNLSQQAVAFQIFGMSAAASPALVLIMAYLGGAAVGAGSLLPFLKGRQEENVAKLKEWRDQDAKLAVEVQSDREKQLEAKIATLESALKQALKK